MRKKIRTPARLRNGNTALSPHRPAADRLLCAESRSRAAARNRENRATRGLADLVVKLGPPFAPGSALQGCARLRQ